MSEEKNTRPDARCGAEFLAGAICWVLSIYVMFKAITFWKEDYVEEFYYSSGLMPMIIGIALFIISISYLIRTLKEHPLKECLSDIKNFAVELVKSKYVHKAIIGLIIMGIYIYLFLGNTPFWIGTFITLSALLLFMNRSKPMSIKNIAKFLLISACGTAAIIIVFEVIFRVPLP